MKTVSQNTLRLIGFAVAALVVVGLSLFNARWATSAQAASATVTLAPAIWWVDPDVVGIEEDADFQIVGENFLNANGDLPIVKINGTEVEVVDAYNDDYGSQTIDVFADGSNFTAGGSYTVTVYVDNGNPNPDMAELPDAIYVIDWDSDAIDNLFISGFYEDEELVAGAESNLQVEVSYVGEQEDGTTVLATVNVYAEDPAKNPAATPIGTQAIELASYDVAYAEIPYTPPAQNTVQLWARVESADLTTEVTTSDNDATTVFAIESEAVDDADRPTLDGYDFGGGNRPSAAVANTNVPTVTMSVQATDPDGFPINEFTYAVRRFSSSARAWVTENKVVWATDADGTVNVPLAAGKSGTYYVLPFIADAQGISDGLNTPDDAKWVNYYAAGNGMTETYEARTVRVFRIMAYPGETIMFSATTSAGDVDAYLYSASMTQTIVTSDTTTNGGTMLSYAVTMTDTYQVEVSSGDNATNAVVTEYGMLSAGTAAPVTALKVDGAKAPTAKVLRSAPVAPPGEKPSVRANLPQAAQVTFKKLFLPIMTRSN